jgi:hypothetical protein
MTYIIVSVISAIAGAVAMWIYKDKIQKQIDRTKEDVKSKL